MGFLGAIGGVVGSLIGANSASKENEKQREHDEYMNSAEKQISDRDKVVSHEMKNSGFYSDYAGQRGRFDREYIQSKFPELNPWEAAGVQGQQGFSQALQGADAIASQTAKSSSTRNVAASSANTSLALAKIGAMTQYKIAELQAETSRANTKDQVAAQNEMVEPNKAKIQSDIETAISQRNVNAQTIKQSAQNIVESEARTKNLQLTQAQIQALTQETYQKINESRARVDNINAITGKTYIDTENAQAELGRQGLTTSQRQAELNKTKYGSSWSDIRGVSNAAGDAISSASSSISTWLSDKFNQYTNETDGIRSQHLKNK